MKMPIVGLVSFGLIVASCTSVPHHTQLGPSDTSTVRDSHGGVSRLQLQSIPEGPASLSFERDAPSGNTVARPLDAVERYMPAPFPAPLEQPSNCDFGGNLVVTFADGFTRTYGPCERPDSINRLWAAMLFEITHGGCAPSCGPDGEPAPQDGDPSATPG